MRTYLVIFDNEDTGKKMAGLADANDPEKAKHKLARTLVTKPHPDKYEDDFAFDNAMVAYKQQIEYYMTQMKCVGANEGFLDVD